jgi:hypothetical protein
VVATAEASVAVVAAGQADAVMAEAAGAMDAAGVGAVGVTA